MKKSRGISALILKIVLFAFVASFLLITVFHTIQYKKNTANLVVQSNEHSVKQLSESFSTFYQQLVYITVQLSSNAALKSYLKDTPADNFEYYRMQRYVNDYLQSYTGFFSYSNVNIILYGKNNCTYSTFDETIHLEETGLLDEPFMKEAADDYKTMGVDFYHKGITPHTEDKYYTFTAYSMFDPNTHSSYGFAVIVIDESSFSDLFSNLKQPNNRFSVISEEGILLSDSMKNQVGHTDKELLNIAENSQTRKPVSYQEKTYIPVAVQNPLFNFWILQLTDYSNISSNVMSNIVLSAIISIVLFSAVAVFLIITVNKITGPIQNLTALMCSVDWEQNPGETPPASYHGCQEAEQLGNAFNKMLKQLHTYIQNFKKAENARRLAELNALQSQINPHFIYNTLTSIKYLSSAQRTEDVTQGITAFINLLRKTIGDTRETISLKEEAELLESYFLIQNLRYGNDIRLILQIPPECAGFSVPKLFLQPLVENSIFHGFSDTLPSGNISVYASLLPDTLQIEVIDNGQGIPAEIADNLLLHHTSEKRGLTGIGIKNINDRIKMIYGNDYGLKISSMEGFGTQITITLPLIQEEKEESHE